jgi:hypothetical protein
LAGAFLAAGAFFGAAFFAAGFFAVAIVFSLITLQRALHVWSTGSDSRRWANRIPGPSAENTGTRTIARSAACWLVLVYFKNHFATGLNPRKERHPIDIQ